MYEHDKTCDSIKANPSIIINKNITGNYIINYFYYVMGEDPF